MKVFRFMVLITAGVLLLLSPVYAGKEEPSARVIKERIITLRNWELMNELNLHGRRAERVFSILKRFDDQRERLTVKRRKLIEDLRRELQRQGRSAERLKDITDQILQVNVELAELKRKELDALSEVLSEAEQARYLLFLEKFSEKVRRLLRRSRPVAPIPPPPVP